MDAQSVYVVGLRFFFGPIRYNTSHNETIELLAKNNPETKLSLYFGRQKCWHFQGVDFEVTRIHM